MKMCHKCSKSKIEKEFAKNSRRNDGLQTICKDCGRKKNREWYRKNSSRKKKVTRENKAKKRSENQEKIRMVTAQYGCQLCGEKDYIVLDFHHVGKKNFCISTAVHEGKLWQKIVTELKKCVCLCANCHRKVHGHKLNTDNLARCVVTIV